MAEAQGRCHWAHTSALMALIANINRDPKKHRAFRPDDFNPYVRAERQAAAVTITDMSMLEKIFESQRGNAWRQRRKASGQGGRS